MAGALKGITIEIGGDTTKLGKALEDVNKRSKNLQTELKGVNTLLKHDPSNTTLLAQKQELLTKAIAETKEKLETLKTAQVQAQEQFEKGEITEEQYRDLQREIVATEQKLEKLTDEAKEFGSVGGQQIEQFGKKLKDTGSKVEDVGKKVSGLSIATGAVLAGSVASFVELDEGYDTIITKTGATGDALDELNQVADNIFGDMPVEMADVGTAVGEINTRFGYTGQELEDLSRKFLQFAEINGVDLNNSIGTVDKILEQFNMDASESGNVLDLITVKAQKTGISADTLMQSIQQNGATFKDMGLGVNEAIGLLAQFEANGVNVEQALKGLKKATTEYAKEGLSMEEGLSKTIKSIKNAKSETEALAIAEEVFGARGAGEMAKAIREGRISIEDLTSSMEEYGGTVEDTFEATLDPIDKGKVAMNNLKLAGSELAGVLQATFAPMLEQLVVKLKDLATWFGNLPEGVQKTIAVTLTITTALGPLIIGIGKLITAIGTIVTIIPKVISGIQALNTAIASSGWGALVIAIGAVIAGLIVYASTLEETKTETEKMCDEMDEFNSKVRDNAKAYNEAKQARDEAMQGTEHEFGYYKQLADELANITDENGKVKKGYEERANTITGILSDALGEEITTDQLVADGKQKVIDKINQLILTKKAEIQLQANEQAYADAIKNSASAVNDYMTAKKNAKTVDDELAKAQKELTKVQEENAYLLERGTNGAQATYYARTAEAQKKVNELTEQQKENNKAVKEAEGVYLGYQTTIQNYEGLSSAIIEGDSAKINTAVNNLVNNFITAETGTKKSLGKQVTNAKSMLENLKLALAEGAPGVTQEMVDNAQDLVNRATAEYNKLVGKGKNAGEKSGKAVADGVKSKEKDAEKAGKDVSDKAKSGAKSVDAKSSGEKVGKDITSGVNAKQTDAKKAGQNVGNKAKSGAGSVDAKSSGEKLGQSVVTGLNAKQGPVNTAGKTLGNKAKSGADSVDASSSGKNFGMGFIAGMDGQHTSIWTSAWNLGKKALSAIKASIKEGSPSRETKKSGGFFGEGFAIGVDDSTPKVLRSVVRMIDAVKKQVTGKKGFDINSPAKWSQDIVDYIADGAVIGVDNSKQKITDAVDGLMGGTKSNVLTTAKEISDGLNENNKAYVGELARLKETASAEERAYLDNLTATTETEKKLYEARRKDVENLKKTIINNYKDIATEAIGSIADLEKAQKSIEEKLSDFGSLYEIPSETKDGKTTITGLPTLADLDRDIDALENYNNTLLKVKERGTPTELFAVLRDMDIMEGMTFAQALLNASDEDFNEYIEDWKRKQSVSAEISKKLYQDEAESLAKEIDGKFDTVTESFFGVGSNSADKFEEGFLNKLYATIGTIKESVAGAFNNVLAEVGVVGTPSSNVIQQFSPGQNTLKVAFDNSLADKLDGIYERLGRLQVVLDSKALVGEIVDPIDNALADKQLLSSRGV